MEEVQETNDPNYNLTQSTATIKNLNKHKQNNCGTKITNKKEKPTKNLIREIKTTKHISRDNTVHSDNDVNEKSIISASIVESEQNVEFEIGIENPSYRQRLKHPEIKTNDSNKYLSVKMIVQYSREFICFLALILTTYATFQNSRQPKVSNAPIPKPIFGRNSFVQEWSDGQLSELQTRLAPSELSLVYFYAPWCSDSLFAKTSFNEAAKLYHKEIYFAAVNCWQPGGECRAHYSKVYKWPVVVAFFPNGLAIQYYGGWDVDSMTQFIDGLLSPIIRVHNNKEFLRLRIEHDAVVLGIFKTSDNIKYRRYFESALKWLEVDPLQHFRFAVYVGIQTDMFVDATEGILPTIKLYNFNETLIFDERNKWDTQKIVSWVQKHCAKSMIWLDVPTSKSSPLTPYFKKGPVVIAFSAKRMLNNDYLMMKQIMYMYRNCQNDSIFDFLNTYIPFLRNENRKQLGKLIKHCKHSSYYQNIETNDFRSCSSLENYNNNQFYKRNGFTSNTSNLKDSDLESKSFCHIRTLSQSIFDYKNCNSPFNLGDQCVQWASHQSARSKSESEDNRSPAALLKSHNDKNCAKILKQIQFLQGKEIKEDNNFSKFLEEFKGSQCKYNRSLSFIILDKLLHHELLLKITGKLDNLDRIPITSSSLFIIDNKDESVFIMNNRFSVPNIVAFIDDFLRGSLERHRRSEFQLNDSGSSDNATLRIKDLNSRNFQEVIEWKNATLIVLIYSAHCALCTVMMQILLQVSLMTIWNKIHFYRIDANVNDLQWEYTMETYPTLLVFPRNRTADTKVFPPTLRVNQKNVFGFILANMGPVEQLKALLTACTNTKLNVPFHNCVKHIYPRITDEINRQLILWRLDPSNRPRTLERLKILKQTYFELQNSKNNCDVKHLLQSKDFLNVLDDP